MLRDVIMQIPTHGCRVGEWWVRVGAVAEGGVPEAGGMYVILGVCICMYLVNSVLGVVQSGYLK